MSRSDDPRNSDPRIPERRIPERRIPERRRFLLAVAKAGVAAPFLATPFMTRGALAQMSSDQDRATMSMGAGHPIGPDVLPATDIPWQEGRCAFCGMTIATPEGGALPPGFRERTYGQMRLTDDADGAGHRALHFESVACLHNYAYATNVRDGHGATFYVADAGASQTPQHGLMLSREATYLWAEGLRVSMAAKMAAYRNDAAAVAALGRLDAPGRHRLLDALTIADLAPLPEMNLIALLARASGLLDD